MLVQINSKPVDLSGDIGAVGRWKVAKRKRSSENNNNNNTDDSGAKSAKSQRVSVDGSSASKLEEEPSTPVKDDSSLTSTSSNSTKDAPKEVKIDLKGNLYTGVIRPSQGLLQLSLHGGEAKIEGVWNSFLDLTYKGSFLDAETTLENANDNDK